jgi:hypothetical protein
MHMHARAAGTKDDWVGSTDFPSKTRGNLGNASGFSPLGATSDASNALLIESGAEGVLFHSAYPGVTTVWNNYGPFSNV